MCDRLPRARARVCAKPEEEEEERQQGQTQFRKVYSMSRLFSPQIYRYMRVRVFVCISREGAWTKNFGFRPFLYGQQAFLMRSGLGLSILRIYIQEPRALCSNKDIPESRRGFFGAGV